MAAGQSRTYFYIGAIVVLIIFYLSTYRHDDGDAPTSAHRRLETWAETDIVPPLARKDHHHLVYDGQRPLGPGLKNYNIELFPYGDGIMAEQVQRVALPQRLPNPARRPKSQDPFHDTIVLPFQQDLTLRTPVFDVGKLVKYKPHNYRGPGNPTFAAFLSSRNNSIHDPYFIAAQQLAYRILWDPKSSTHNYPFTVFVAPHIPAQQRLLLEAAGALVRELELLEWRPNCVVDGRWRDVFSKLNLWKQIDFSRIAFLDLDAFPLQNVDDIFDAAPRQHCLEERLLPEELARKQEFCDYTFAGVEAPGTGLINAGVLVLEPNMLMHGRLISEMAHRDRYDNRFAEQALLNHAFAKHSPFPLSFMGREWNGFYPKANEQRKLKIVHEKLWAYGDELPWTKGIFESNWHDMLKLYESGYFMDLRRLDGLRD